LLGEWGIPVDSPAGRRHFARGLEARRQSEQAQTVEQLPPSSWCIGSEQFRWKLFQQMTVLSDRHYGGPEWRETVETRTQHILLEELQKRGWDWEGLKHRRKVERPLRIRRAWIQYGSYLNF
jgi:hypothetical protein